MVTHPACQCSIGSPSSACLWRPESTSAYVCSCMTCTFFCLRIAFAFQVINVPCVPNVASWGQARPTSAICSPHCIQPFNCRMPFSSALNAPAAQSEQPTRTISATLIAPRQESCAHLNHLVEPACRQRAADKMQAIWLWTRFLICTLESKQF